MVEEKAEKAISQKSYESIETSSESVEVDNEFGFNSKFFDRDLLTAYWERFKLKHVLPW